MYSLEHQPECTVKNSEQEVTIWEFIIVLIRNWKIVLIMVLAFVLIGTAYGFFSQRHDYIFNQKIIYNDDYYLLGYADTYEHNLKKYLDDNFNNSQNISVEYKENSDNEFCLKVTYYEIPLDEANEITNDIINRHNTMIYDDLDSLVNLKKEEVNLSYDEYKDKQNEYYDFLYSEDGYYNTEDDLSRYQSYVHSYKKQLESREKMLLKVQNGFPLLLEEIYLSEGMPIEYYQRDEIIENHYSEENLQKEVEFLQGALNKSQQTYNEIAAAFKEMVTTEVTLKADRDDAMDSWESTKTELEKLEYDFSIISEYYIDDSFQLAEDSGKSLYLYIGGFFLAGILLAAVFVLLKMSYLDYKSKSQ